jgi:DNA repair exonuclease SbcCD ATPase subunit
VNQQPQPYDESGVHTSVSYSVKELFEEIKTSLDKLDTKLSSKASRDELQALASELQHEVNELNNRLASQRGRIDRLEAAKELAEKTTNAVSEWKKWFLPTLLTIALVVIAILQLMKTK